MTERIIRGSDGSVGVHRVDSLRGPKGAAVFEPLTHMQKVRIDAQAHAAPLTDLFLGCDGVDVRLRPAAPLESRTRRWIEGPMHAMGKRHADRLRDYVRDEAAMNAPFESLRREKFCGTSAALAVAASASAERSDAEPEAAALTGLVSSKTKAAGLREEIEIDVYASRVRKLGKAVKNSAHILDAHAHTQDSWQRWRRLFVTLTYRSVEDWQAGHIRDFQRSVRDWFRRKCNKTRMRMVWVLELQKRGAVHYHCMIWIRSKDFFPKPDACGWWPHGQSNVLPSKVKIERPVSYMAKYCSKVTTEQAMGVPKGARMYGVCGLDSEGKRVVRYWRSPLFVRDHFGGKADVRKAQGGYCNKLTGEFLASPWKVTVLPSGRVIAWREIPPLQEAA